MFTHGLFLHDPLTWQKFLRRSSRKLTPMSPYNFHQVSDIWNVACYMLNIVYIVMCEVVYLCGSDKLLKITGNSSLKRKSKFFIIICISIKICFFSLHNVLLPVRSWTINRTDETRATD